MNFTQSATRRSAKILIVLIVLSVVGSLTYMNTLNVPFILDDIPNIVDNPWIRMTEINATQLARVSKSITPRPFAHLITAFNYYFDHYHVTGYHVVNILIHLFNSMLIFFLAEQIVRRYRVNAPILISCLIALAWQVHPLHTQSVTYIVQRMNTLATLFYLLALACYIKARSPSTTKRRAVVSKTLLFAMVVLSGILGLACKPIAATLPVMLFLYEWYFLQDLSFAWLKQQSKWLIPLALLLIVISGIYLGTSPIHKILSMYDTQAFTMGQRLLTEPGVIMFYLSLLAFPHPARLTIDHAFPIANLTTHPISAVLPITALLALISLVIMCSRRHRLLVFAVLWFLVNLVIESSVLGLALIFEHRTYLPSIFLFIFAGTLFAKWQHSFLKIALTGAILLTCILWSYQRNTVWQDAIRFWEDGVAKAPRHARPYASLGAIWTQRGRPDHAITIYQQALTLDADDIDTYYNLGVALQKTGKLSKAGAMYRQALALSPQYPKAYHNLGVILAQTGHVGKAMTMYRKATAIDPGYADAYNHLGVALVETGHIQEAMAMYQKALALNPQDADIYNNLGLALNAQNKISEAIALYQKALAINPDDIEARVNIGVALIGRRQPDRALPYLLKALRQNPQKKEIHTNLAIAYAQTGRLDKAIDHCRQALAISPDCAATMFNLGLIYQQQGQLEKARQWLSKATDNAPDNIQMRLSLAETLIDAKDYKTAVTHLQAVLALAPDNLSALMTLGTLYAREKDDVEAIRVYNQLTRHLPDNPAVYYNLACLYARNNRIAAAADNLKQAIVKGYTNWDRIKTDPDLANMRQTNDYQVILKNYFPHAADQTK